MKRTEARELLFTLLYEAQFSDPGNYDEIYRTELRCRGIEDDEYVRRVFYGIGENLTEIDGIIDVMLRDGSQEDFQRLPARFSDFVFMS